MMRRHAWILVVLLAASALWTQPAAAQATSDEAPEFEPPEIAIPRVEGAVSVDGVLDEEAWSAGLRMEIAARLGQTGITSDDLTAEARVFWNDEGLYAGVSVTDDALFAAGEDDSLAEYDSVDLWLDTLWIQIGPARESDPRVQIRQLAGFPRMNVVYEAALQRDASGYAVEILIPTSLWREALGVAPANDETVHFAVGVRDRDDEETRAVGKLYFPIQFGWNNTESMAVATLSP